jgi:hypothetical protein
VSEPRALPGAAGVPKPDVIADEGKTGKPRNPVKISLIVVACVLVVSCASAGLAAFLAIRAARNADKPPRTATEAYLGHLQRGDIDAAYAGLCASDLANVTKEDFAKAVGPAKPTTFTLDDTDMLSDNGEQSAVVTVQLNYVTGLHERKLLVLRPEHGVWKVCDGSYR